MKLIYSILMLLFFTSCTQMLLHIKGIKNPKIENANSINNFVKSYNLDTSNLFVLKDSSIFNDFVKSKMLSIPDALFFNKAGKYIDYKKTPKECNAKIGDFISKIDSISNALSNSALNLSYLESHIVKLNSAVDNNLKNDFEIAIVITSAKYLGDLNKDKVFEWESVVNKLRSMGHKIRYYKLFMDYMDFWGMRKNELFKIL